MAGRSAGSFSLLWISQALSQLGTSVSSLAYPLLLLEATGSAVTAGLVGATVAVVGLAVRVPGGIVAARYRYKSLMLFSDAARAIAVGTIAVTVLAGVVSVPLVLVAVALEVAFGAAFGPAEFALVRLLVPQPERAIAVGRMQSRSQVAGLLGPALGGALYGIQPALPFLADSASYIASFVLVLLVPAPRSAGPERSAGRATLTAGWRWLRRHPFLLIGGCWVAALTATFGAVGLAILVFAQARGATPTEIGFMFAISTAGGVVGALCTPALQRRFRPGVIFRAAAVLDAMATLALLPLTSPYAIGVAGAVAFFLAPTVSASLFGRLSTDCPDHLVVTAQAALSLIVGSLAPLAPILTGWIIDRTNASIAILATAISFIALAIAAFSLRPFRSRPEG